jgi:uncharacterized membrane protein YidH (DUF202 family)
VSRPRTLSIPDRIDDNAPSRGAGSGARHVASSRQEIAMPLLILLVLIIMIAQLGFWDTFQAILGGVAMIILFILLATALVTLVVALAVRRMRRSFR